MQNKVRFGFSASQLRCLKALANEDTLLRTHCCPWCSWAAQTGKHLLRTQNVSEQNQKHFLCPGHKLCVRNKCCARGQTGKHFCWQQCVCNKVCSFARAFSVLDSQFFRDLAHGYRSWNRLFPNLLTVFTLKTTTTTSTTTTTATTTTKSSNFFLC